MKEVYIVSAKRTPVGGFLGSLSSHSATELGAIAIQHTYQSAGVDPSSIDSVYLGNVLSANLGQSPARQASVYAGIPHDKDCTTINKVCASGIKATMLGAQQIQLGFENLVITGGMESMSNAPHYVLYRKGNKLGDTSLIDGLLKDGLTDAYHHYHMGNAAELCVKEFGISRAEQDYYALQSYAKANKASADRKFQHEMIPVTIEQKGSKILLHQDEDIDKVIVEKVPQLKPVFDKEGTITAANASNINDGAAALLLASAEALKKFNLKPLAKIIAFADAARQPERFTTDPSIAIQRAANYAGLSLSNIDFFEINEAYAAVAIANQKLLNIPSHKLNVYGGAIAIGHPLGASGARILCTLLSVLIQEGGRFGVAAICNGGGGASAMIIENLTHNQYD